MESPTCRNPETPRHGMFRGTQCLEVRLLKDQENRDVGYLWALLLLPVSVSDPPKT